jgi:dienelactone hydrolase
MSAMRARRAIVIAAVAGALGTTGYIAGHDYVESAAFVIRAADMGGPLRWGAGLEAEDVATADVVVPWRAGSLRARSYRPADISGRAVLLAPGVHAGGIEEPRLINFAREIAATGHPVVTVELPDLAQYRITPRSTDMLEDAALWVRSTWAPEVPAGADRVGLAGISFAGGLAVVAAGRIPQHAAWALSLGGHGDLPRTLRYLCTGVQPDGVRRPPHDYGVAIILLGIADRMVPAAQAEGLRGAIRAFLHASHVDVGDKTEGARAFARAREMAASLEDPARRYMEYVNTRNVEELGPALLPHIGELGGDPALSPERSPAPAVPVYLLHGADDNVVPAVESAYLAEDLRRRGVSVEQLASPLITHAEVDRTPGAAAVWKLVRFWSRPL